MSFFKVRSGFYLALHDEDASNSLAKSEFARGYFVVTQSASLTSVGSLQTFSPSLAEVHRFDAMVQNLLRAHGQKFILVFSIGRHVQTQVRLAFLVGCNLIMSHGFGPDEAFAALKPMHLLFHNLELDVPMINHFQALCEAKRHQWIDFRDMLNDEDAGADSKTMDMEEYVHYARYGKNQTLFYVEK